MNKFPLESERYEPKENQLNYGPNDNVNGVKYFVSVKYFQCGSSMKFLSSNVTKD